MGEANQRGTFADRKKFREEARAAREWRLNNPAPKKSHNPFLPVTDEPLELTDDLYSRLVDSVKFKRMSKSNFDYLRSQNILYDTRTHTFFSSQRIVSEPKAKAEFFVKPQLELKNGGICSESISCKSHKSHKHESTCTCEFHSKSASKKLA
ncbi:MAG: hypothetical protein PHN45_06130, partial [Methylococcales bacterium]|nr:hypothetical protein [Methylococcales bacterium]